MLGHLCYSLKTLKKKNLVYKSYIRELDGVSSTKLSTLYMLDY